MNLKSRIREILFVQLCVCTKKYVTTVTPTFTVIKQMAMISEEICNRIVIWHFEQQWIVSEYRERKG